MSRKLRELLMNLKSKKTESEEESNEESIKESIEESVEGLIGYFECPKGSGAPSMSLALRSLLNAAISDEC